MELIEIAQLVTGIATLIVASVLIWQMVIQKRTLEIAHKDADSNMSLSAVQIHAENGKWISENINKSIKLNYSFDESLLGGVILQIGSLMIDASLKNKLQKYKKLMIES